MPGSRKRWSWPYSSNRWARRWTMPILVIVISLDPRFGGAHGDGEGEGIGPTAIGGISTDMKKRIQTGFNPSRSSTCTLFDPNDGHVIPNDPHRRLKVGQGELEAQDTVSLGIYEGIHRFMLISKIGRDSSMKAELAGTDGILGLAYSTERGTASLLRTLSDPDRSRSSWGIVQPSIFGMLKPLIFAMVASQESGELQVGGFDPSAALTTVRYTRIHNSTRDSPYTVRVKGIRYGGRDILFFGDGGDQFIDGSFDTGSDCVMLPDSQFGALEASPFRSLLEAHVKHGRQRLTFVLSDDSGDDMELSLPYDSWTHPGGCLGPFSGKNIVFGVPVFREYLVVHDLTPPVFRMGIAPVNPQYKVGKGVREWNYGGESSVLEQDDEGFLGEGRLLKMALSTHGGKPARRYMARIGVGTPSQVMWLVVDTGSYEVDILAWGASAIPKRQLEEAAGKNKTKDAEGSAKSKAAALAKLKKKSLAKIAALAKLKKKAARGLRSNKGDSKRAAHKSKDGISKHREGMKQEAHQRLETASRDGGRTDHETRGREGAVSAGGGLTEAQAGWLALFGAVIGVLLVGELRRQRVAAAKPRFRLVEYAAVPGGRSRIEFSDCV